MSVEASQNNTPEIDRVEFSRWRLKEFESMEESPGKINESIEFMIDITKGLLGQNSKNDIVRFIAPIIIYIVLLLSSATGNVLHIIRIFWSFILLVLNYVNLTFEKFILLFVIVIICESLIILELIMLPIITEKTNDIIKTGTDTS